MDASNGEFVWHELRVVDLDRAVAFYGELFGWTIEEYPMGRTIRSGDAVIGGMSEVKPGLGGHWTPYIAVDDVDAAADAASAAGGRVTTGRPADVPGEGRIAPILDPHMTIFAAYRPLRELGRSPRGFVWDRLRTPDPAASAEFYRRVLGWTPTLAPDGGVFDLADGTRVAEFLPADEGEPTGWLPFVGVADLDASRRRAEALGATVTDGPVDVPGVGSFVTIADPEGASLALHQQE